jgi:hypothetical protein
VGFPAYPPCRSSLASHALVTRGSERDLFGAPKDRRQDAAAAPELIDRLSVTSSIGRAVHTMRSSKIIHVVTCHAEGEVSDVIVGGVAPPPGETLWEQSRFIAKDRALRNFVLNEPPGGVVRHVSLLVPAKDSRAQMGFIIMEPEDTPPMSGSNSICVATVLLDAGILPMQESETRLTLDAQGGLIAVTAECRNGKAERISIENVPFVRGIASMRHLRLRAQARSRSTLLMVAIVSSSSMRRRSASRFVRMKRATSRRRASTLSLPPTISLASRIPRAPAGAGTTSPSVSSPGRSRASEMNFRMRTPWSSVPARLTARRQARAVALVWPL